jgi:hypothetical protein
VPLEVFNKGISFKELQPKKKPPNPTPFEVSKKGTVFKDLQFKKQLLNVVIELVLANSIFCKEKHSENKFKRLVDRKSVE